MSAGALRDLQLGAERAADELVGAALRGDRDCVEAVCSEPEEHWPAPLVSVVATIRELHDDGVTVDDASVYVRGCIRGLSAERITQLSGKDVFVGNVDSRTAILREYHQRAALASQARAVLAGAEDIGTPLDELRQVVQDIDVPFRPRAAFTVANFADWQSLAKQSVPTAFWSAMPRGRASALVGAPKTGKSTYALQAGIGLALDRELAPGLRPIRRGKVLFLFSEDPSIAISQRMQALCEIHNIDPLDIDAAIASGYVAFGPEEPAPLVTFDRTGQPRRTEYFERVKEYTVEHKPDLVVFDPFVAFGGCRNENDNMQVQDAMQAFIALARAANCAVLVLHHASKVGGHSTDQTASRGASSMQGSIRWQMNLTPILDDDVKRFELAPTDVPLYVRATVTCNQYFPRAGISQYLKRDKCGILVMTDIRAETWSVLAQRLVAVISERDSHLSARDLCYARGDEVKAVRAEVGDPKRADMERAIKFAVETGLLAEVEVPGPGKQRHELRPTCPN